VDYIQPRRVDIIQPDLETVGLTGGRRLSYLAWLNHLRMIPHNWGTAIRTAATLHWLACAPTLTGGMYAPKVMFEFDQTESPFRDVVVRQSLKPDLNDGTLAVPEGPGLGVDVVAEAVSEFRTRLIEIR